MNHSLRSTVITAHGVASPLGHSSEALFESLLRRESALKPIDRFDTSVFPTSLGAVVTDFQAKNWVGNRKNLKLMSDAVRLGMAGVKRAFINAGLTEKEFNPERFGIYVGSGTAVGKTEDLLPAIAAASDEDGFNASDFGSVGMHRINPLWLLKGLSNNVLGFSTADLDARATNQNYCNSGVGGLQAIGEAAWAIAERRADLIIAGGADSAVNPLHFAGFGRLNALTQGQSAEAVRPFGQGHDGFAVGEGSAFFLLESEQNALAAGREPIARLAGYSNACAAHALGRGDSEVTGQAIRQAIEQAGWQPRQVDLVYAHGNATPRYDEIEATALRAVFGDRQPPVTSNKANIGHTIASSGPLSLACALMSMKFSSIAPIPFSETLAPECAGLNAVFDQPVNTAVKRCLVSSAGLGGQVTVLAVELPQTG